MTVKIHLKNSDKIEKRENVVKSVMNLFIHPKGYTWDS